MSEFAGNSSQVFMNFRCLEYKLNVQSRIQTGMNQQLVISSPDTANETVEISATEKLPVKTMTVVQSAHPGANTDDTTTQEMEGVPR